MGRSVGNVVQNGKSTAVIIPRTKLRELGWQRGDHVAIWVERGMLIVVSLEQDVERTRREAAELAHGIQNPPAL